MIDFSQINSTWKIVPNELVLESVPKDQVVLENHCSEQLSLVVDWVYQ